MNQKDDRVSQLESEIRMLKAQLEQNRLPSKDLNKLLEYGKEVIFYMMNDDRFTVKEMSESISVFGYAADDFVSGKISWKNVVFEDDLKLLCEYINNEVLNCKESFEYEHQIITKKKKKAWIFCDFIPDFDRNGALVGFLVKIKDVSKRKNLTLQNELVFLKNISAIRGVLDNSTDGIMLIDVKGIVREWSKGYERITGLEKEKVIGKYAWDVAAMAFHTVAERERIQKELRELVRNMQSKIITGTITNCKTGEHRIINVIHFPVEIPGGRILGGISRDITDEVRSHEQFGKSERRLKKSESTIRSIFEHSADGMMLIDRNGIIREWSSGYEKITGLDKETVIGKLHVWDVGKLLFPADVHSVEELHRMENELKELVRKMQQKAIVRHTRHTKTGEYRIFNVLYFPVAMPEGVMLGGISRDVTEETRSREMLEKSQISLQKSESTIRSIFENSIDGIVLIDSNGIIREWSAGFEKASGLDKETVIGKLHIWDTSSLVFPEDRLPKEGLRTIENELKELVRNMQPKKVVRHVKNRHTGEYRVQNIMYFPVAMPEGMMIGGICSDITEEVHIREQLEESKSLLTTEKERLQMLGDNIPRGTLFQFAINQQTNKMFMAYISAKWEMITGISAKEVMDDVNKIFEAVHPDDELKLRLDFRKSVKKMADFIHEIRFNTLANGHTRWLNVWAQPRREGDLVIWDGIAIDVTKRKNAEAELTKYRKELENLVTIRTEELKIANEELNTSLEELNASNESLYSLNDELVKEIAAHKESEEKIRKYQTELETMVEEKTAEVIEQQKSLEEISRRQEVLIKVLQMMQTAEDPMQTLQEALAEVSRYAEVSRVNVFEKSADGSTVSNIVNWCKEGVESNIEKLQNIPVSLAPWFDIQDDREHFYSDEDPDLSPELIKAMNDFGVKTILVFPLTSGGVNFGFVDFNGPEKKIWNKNEVEMLKSLSQIISTTRRRYLSETALRQSHKTILTVLNNITPFIVVTDLETKKILYVNNKLKELIGEELEGKICWQVLHKGQKDVCTFCPRHNLFNENSCPTGIYHFKQENKIFGQHTAVDAVLVEWIDGRKALLEMGVNITALKLAEKELIMERDRLQSIGDHFPGGALFRWEVDRETNKLRFTYLSKTWTDITGLDLQMSLDDVSYTFSTMVPEDAENLMKNIIESNKSIVYQEKYDNCTAEVRFYHPSGEIRWMQIVSHPNLVAENQLIYDGFVLDITARKESETELAKYREKLESLVKQRTEEYEAANEQLHFVNEKLRKYQTKLELMVKEQTAEIILQQDYLEKLSQRQAVLIRVLQIAQTTENYPQTINDMFAEIGKYSGVSRIISFEKSVDGTAISCISEWCNEGIAPVIQKYQNVPVEIYQPWFDIFDAGEIINTSDINTLPSKIVEVLHLSEAKSSLNLPLTANGVHYGYIALDECTVNRAWDENEIKILKSLSQIISATRNRYQAETALRQSHKSMLMMLNNINAYIVVVDFETMKILFANDRLKKLAGVELEGVECWKVLEKHSKICDYCPKNQVLECNNNNSTGVFHFDHYNELFGRHLAIDAMAIEWIDRQSAQLEVAVDITERKIAEDALRQSEMMYRQLTAASPDAIVVCSRMGRLLYTSPKAMELFGIEDFDKMRHTKLIQYVHPQDRRPALEFFKKLWSENVSFIPQLLLYGNGSEFIGEITAATVKETNSIIMVIRDITRRKMEEMELIQAKEKAEESNKLKSAFLANISHEIRTPINGITGFLQILASEELSPDVKQEYVNDINKSCSRLVRQIDDIIDVAKIEAGQMTIKPVPVSVNDLMNELYTYFDLLIQNTKRNKDITLLLDQNEFLDRCVTYIDPVHFRHILNCLIDNAIKFTEKGHIRFGYRQSSPSQLEFIVEDTGIGLPSDFQGIIFDSFRQVEISNNRTFEGSGLGLTISQGLVKILGGEMKIESSQGNGSIFSFTISYLPVTEKEQYLFEQPDKTSTKNKPFANKSVLLVEPEILKYRYYEKLLVAAGFTVSKALNIHQWLEFISQTKHIDIEMVDVSILKQASEMEINQIKSIRTDLPMLMYGAKHSQAFINSPNYFELEEPLSYEEIVGTMRVLMRS